MALFYISTRWLFICKIHLLKNISAKKIQISYFYQNEIHLLRNSYKYRRRKISIPI